MTIADALAQAQEAGLARLDAQLLLLHALGRTPDQRAWLLAHDEQALTPAVGAAFEAFCQRRLAGEPTAYLLGHKAFAGLDLRVDARVLVPRPETEMLAEWALALLAAMTPRDQPGARSADTSAAAVATAHPPQVIDLGTGSGAIALALKAGHPAAQVLGIDRSADALAVAHANASRLGLTVELRQGRWLHGLTGRFDLIVSNPPYIARDDPHLEALRHEPPEALVAGADGLDDIREIIAQAPAHLTPGGWLLLEHGWDQAAAVRHLLAAQGFTDVQSRLDLAGIERCSGGRHGAGR